MPSLRWRYIDMIAPDIEDIFLLDDIDDMNIFGDEEVETTKKIESKSIKINEKIKLLSLMKKEHLSQCLKEIPKLGESLHIISNGSFDFWTFIPFLIDKLGGVGEFFGSTWTLNRQNCKELLELFDEHKIKKIGFLTGLYFKRREASVYSTLLTGLSDRGQKYKCLENHAKVAIFENGSDYITIEGSANFTSNPRIEQYTISNSRELFYFHREWMEGILS